MNKSIDIFAFSDSRGGAAIAAKRQVSLVDKENTIRFIVAEKLSSGTAKGPTKWQFYRHFFYRIIELIIIKVFCNKCYGKKSLNIFCSPHCKNELLNSKADIIHFHWINNDTISINILTKILNSDNRKFVITMHDDWLIANYEHCIPEKDNRYINGYNKRTSNLIDRIFYRRKIKLRQFIQKENVVVTVPSNYLKNKSKNSKVLSNSDIEVIGNPIDTHTFIPISCMSARKIYNLESDVFVILYGGGGSYLKGGDLLIDSLNIMSNLTDKKILLLSFGNSLIKKFSVESYEVIEVGLINSDQELATLYSCADITVVPSRIESFGQVAAESLACETPVIAFDNSGLTDIIQHNQSGFLVPAFDTRKLAQHIIDFSNYPKKKRLEMGKLGRDYICNNFSTEIISLKWNQLYNKIGK